MNLPNKLSIIRALCIPVITVLLYMDNSICRLIAGIIFILACLTDFIDGHIARKYHLVTDFGKFIDPVADKLLVLTIFIMLIHLHQMDAWIVILILCRELSVDGLRLVAVTQGKVIAAGPLGKWKTTFQMVLIAIMILFNLSVYQFWPVTVLAMIVVALTLISGVDYFLKNRSVLSVK